MIPLELILSKILEIRTLRVRGNSYQLLTLDELMSPATKDGGVASQKILLAFMILRAPVFLK